MPLDLLPSKLVVETRQQLHDMFLLWMAVRNPATDSRPGGAPDLDASVWADAATLILNKAIIISGNVSRSTAVGPVLDIWAQLLGTQRNGAVGAGGSVVSTGFSSNGAQLRSGDLLTYAPSNLTYFVSGVTGTYLNGQPIGISGKDTGPQTDLPPGAVLTWKTSRPGVNLPTVTVLPQADGSGLSGGAGPELDTDLQQRLQFIASNPPASGNDSDYQSTITQSTGIGIQQPFTICGVQGSGTMGVMFTLRPGTPGANRIPSPSQMQQVLSWLGGEMPGSDGIYMCQLIPFKITVVLKAIWSLGSPGWADSTLFPLYHAPPAPDTPNTNLVAAAKPASGSITPTTFRLQSPAMTEVPQVGQSVAFLDLPNQVFRRKKILSVTTISATQYDVVVDTSSGVSDTSYSPLIGQPCCPWSDSLQDTIAPVLAYFDKLGPSEQFSAGDLFDPGRRRRRSPANPQFWPNLITNRLLGGSAVPQAPQGPQQNQPPVPTLFNTASLADVELIEPAPPFSAPIGVPGVFSNLPVLGSLIAFPEP